VSKSALVNIFSFANGNDDAPINKTGRREVAGKSSSASAYP